MSSRVPDSAPLRLGSLVVRSPLVVSPNATVMDAVLGMSEAQPAAQAHLGEPTGSSGNGTQTSRSDAHQQIRSSCVLVVDAGRCIGMLTAADVVRLSGQRLPLDHTAIREVMSPVMVSLSEAALNDPTAIAQLTHSPHVRYLPVLDGQDYPVGLISGEGLRAALAGLDYTVTLPETDELALLSGSGSDPQHRTTASTPAVAATEAKMAQEKLLATLADQIRSSLDTQHVLDEAVTGVRSLLNCSRVIVYQLRPDFSGVVVAEAIVGGDRSVLHSEIHDPCVSPEWIEPYRQGEIRIVNDVYTASMTLCHREMLLGFDIRAKLMVPIIIQNQLWGLMIASHRDRPRQWQSDAVDLVRQLSTQVAIALHQATTHQKLQLELRARRRIEALLFESEQRYASLTAVAPVGIFRTDAASNCTYVNDRYCQLTGITLASALDTGWQQTLHPDDRSRVLSAWEQAIREGQPFQLEYRFLRPTDGVVVWVYGQAMAERDAQGRITGHVGTLTDITEQKQAEAALRQSELTNRAIIDTIPDLLIQMDRQGYYSRMVGGSGVYVKHPSQTPVRPDIYNVLSPENAEQRLHYARQAIDTGNLQVYEQVFDYDGNLRSEEVRIAPLNSQEVLVIIRDITDRKRAEAQLEALNQQLEAMVEARTAALRASEERYRSIYNQAAVGLANTTADGKFLNVNLKLCQMLGYSRRALLAKTVLDITHADDGCDLLPAMQQLFSGDLPSVFCEKRYLRQDGTVFWASMGLSVVRDGEGRPQHTLAVISDISDRKQAEAQAHALLNRTQLLNRISSEIRESLDLSVILQNLVNAIVTELPADICTFAWYSPQPNAGDLPRWEVVKEQKAADLPSWIGVYQADDVPDLLESIVTNQIYRVDTSMQTCSTGLRARLDQAGLSTFLCLPIHTVSGKIGSLQIGRMSTHQPWQSEDIELLQSVANQVAIAIYQAELYEESQAKTEQLQRSYQDLEEAQLHMIQSEKMSSLGQLVAGIAHEINNPVGFIYGNLAAASDYASSLIRLIEMYREYYPEPYSAIATLTQRVDIEYILSDFPKLLVSMENGATRIRDIVRSLRTFSRLEQADSSAVDLHERIDNTLVLLQNRLNGRAGNPEIHIVKRYGDLPPVECYASLLDQVVMNLLANAVDAIEERQANAAPDYIGCIMITTAPARNHKVLISIKDNGVGMTPATQAKIFNPFFTTKPVGIGTGMGLSISYQIVTGNHQGQLFCRSTLGAGTEFTVELCQILPNPA